MRVITLLSLIAFSVFQSFAQGHSVARRWNEVLLEAIRNDYARPTVHARNLFHTSIALYDGWAVFDPVAECYMLGKTVHDYDCPFNGITYPVNVEAAQEEVMSYAAYRLLSHRFANSANPVDNQMRFDTLMTDLGYDINFTSTDYSTGSYAALGNHLAANIIAYGMQDGANEQGGYENQYYAPVNPTLIPALPGNPDIVDPNRWQPLTLLIFIDQSGNVYPINTPSCLSPEWGQVLPFSMTEDYVDVYHRDGFDYRVYHDPGKPPHLDTSFVDQDGELYKWAFELVAYWSSHLSTEDSVLWDISPASIGNIQDYPTSFADYPNFYDLQGGGDPGAGYVMNPSTGQPYAPQIVKRGDYTRVLAEFWADGPSSETPPGHWFTILNYVSDHDSVEKRFMGSGPLMSDLEWDVKAYFTLGGAMHDAAVASWGAKGWYDYVRPISAIRFMADIGQSSSPDSANYHPAGLKLYDGIVELVDSSDALAGSNYEHVGKVKLNVWRGHDYITDPQTDVAGVGWILAENWWPYQRPSFVTPPFAGYVSGHSTYSRTAAEVMTLFTGDAYFPGGMGEFHAPMNEFLVFEDGPSTDVTLQWAKYFDASDQCSLSRIWGGIHPPLDDIPGRLMGMEIGPEAFYFAKTYFDGTSIVTDAAENSTVTTIIYPNPTSVQNVSIHLKEPVARLSAEVYDMSGKCCHRQVFDPVGNSKVLQLTLPELGNGLYTVRLNNGVSVSSHSLAIVK